MTNSINIFFISTILLILLSDANSTKLLPYNNQSGYSHRLMLFQSISKQVTELKPDEDSKPLRVSKEELGRFTWVFLHSVAAAYPKNPTDIDKVQLSNLLNSIPYMYPCKDCAGHFGTLLKSFPIKDNSREELVGYVCLLHNKVNERLNKPQFDCTKALSYWGGDCGCSG